MLGFVARDHDIRGTAVAAIMEQHTVTSRRHLLGERQDTAKVAATTGGKRHPRTILTKDLVVDVHASYVGYRHRSSSRLIDSIAGPILDAAIMLPWRAPVND